MVCLLSYEKQRQIIHIVVCPTGNSAMLSCTNSLTTMDGGNADFASLHGCSLLGRYSSNCRGVKICPAFCRTGNLSNSSIGISSLRSLFLAAIAARNRTQPFLFIEGSNNFLEAINKNARARRAFLLIWRRRKTYFRINYLTF